MLTQTEENYIKIIYRIAEKEKKSVSTNAISDLMGTQPASVTDMIKKLAEKELVTYEKYKGVNLTASGIKVATQLIRNNRLWKTFLVEKLRFGWHQIDQIADDLEHMHTSDLISRLDAFMDYPKFDPFGDPIPNTEGKFTIRHQMSLTELPDLKPAMLLGIKEQHNELLKHLSQIHIKPGCEITIIHKNSYDQTMQVSIDGRHNEILSKEVAQVLLVRPR
jgi:DtxR family Mn-dependent transcriptional regulator